MIIFYLIDLNFLMNEFEIGINIIELKYFNFKFIKLII